MINRLEKIKKKENQEKNQIDFEKCKGNSKLEWKMVKEKLYGNTLGHPERILEGNKLVRGTKRVAGVFNRFYITKVRKILQNMEDPKQDPMESYKKFIKRRMF